MKTKIKVKVLTEGCMPEISESGDWVDLRSAIDIHFNAPQYSTLRKVQIEQDVRKYRDVTIEDNSIPLGVAIELPKGFEAVINSRSSSPSKFSIIPANGQGVVDNTYHGNNDMWYYVCAPIREAFIRKGDRICQFRIQLSQKATMWQKLKWLFSSGIELVEVEDLKGEDRGGLGSTGIK